MSVSTNIIYSCHFGLRIILLIVLGFFQFIHPQPFPSKYIFEKLSIEHGLSSSAIYSLHQDRTGFLWIGTENGINRFDGYSFKYFKHDPEVQNSISDNFIWDINEDKLGNLWFATGRGLDKYDPVTGSINRFLNDPDDTNSISANDISSLAFDSENNLWIGTWSGGFNVYDFKTKKILRYTAENSKLQSNVVWNITKDSKNNIWIGTDGSGLLRYNYNGKTFDQFLHDSKNKNSISGNIVTSVCEDAEGNIWIGTYGDGLNRYDYNSNRFIHFKNNPADPNSIPDNSIWKVFKDSRGLLWVGGVSKGLSVYNSGKNLFTRIPNNPYDPQSMSSDLILDIIEDRTNNLWIGTVNGGLNKINLKPRVFYHLNNELNNPQSLIGNFVFSICEDKDGDIWIANYEKGISRYTPSKNKYKFYTHNPADPKSISNNQVRCIYEDKRGDIWIGTFFGGLNKYDRATDSFIRYKADGSENNISNNNVRSMYEDEEGNFWIGTSGGGLNKFDRSKGKFIHYNHNPENDNSLSNNSVTSIAEDDEGNLWLGTYDGGLNKFNKKNNSFIRYVYSKDDLNSISNNVITYLFKDSDGRLWAGTWGGGINVYDKLNDNFIHFREKDGLLNEIVCGIGEDKKGNLWISTVKGISKFNFEKKEFKNFDINDGIQKGELNTGAFFINEKGWIFFGGSDGVNVFYPDSLKQNPVSSNIVITSFKKFNEEFTGETQPEFLNTIELNFDEDVISFEFSYLDFSQPLKTKYAYKIEGSDKDWVYSGSRRFATYTHLNPGKYTFKVKATNSDGIWNEKPDHIKILIKPPWWQTGWAYAGYIVVIISGLVGIRRFEKNRIRLRNELRMHEFESQKLKEIEVMKSRFFANLSHEFRTPLMLIKGPAEQLMNESSDNKSRQQLQIITRNTENLKNLIDQLLELSQLEAASIPLRAKEENLIIIIRGLIFSFESLAKEKNISLKFDSAEDNLIAWLDKDKLEKIMNNLMSNALKFTNEGGIILVTVEKSNNTHYPAAEIRISDSGIGIPESKLNRIFDRFFQADNSSPGGSGIGLALVKELVELHKWNISVTSKENIGTEFTLQIPLTDYLSETEKAKGGIQAEDIKLKNIVIEKNDTGIYNREDKMPEKSGGKPTLLIVEDSEDVRLYMSDLLGKEYNIIESGNGKEGIKSASENSPDLIISDIMMPEMDGIEFCKKIKTDFQTSHIPVILLTARVSDESKYEGLETGADDYLTKPFDSKELFIRVKNLLEQRKRLKEKFGKDINVNPSFITKNPVDKEFLERAFSIAEKNLDNPDFDAESFAKELFMSLSQLRRKLKAVTGQAPGEFLRIYKLKRAAQMILEKRLNITQISLEVGFNSPSHFTKAFREQFNCLPSDFKG